MLHRKFLVTAIEQKLLWFDLMIRSNRATFRLDSNLQTPLPAAQKRSVTQIYWRIFPAFQTMQIYKQGPGGAFDFVLENG